MSFNLHRDVFEFHKKFEIPIEKYPAFPVKELLDFRMKFLREEVDEFGEAVRNDDIVKAFDALIDVVYVAIGTAVIMNLPFEKGWDIVHSANMTKIRARNASQSKRGTAFDVVKPSNWIAPDMMLHSLLLKHEYELKTKRNDKEDDE
jgi:predicted HAD superfamily Cof-like phosphohydrolase